MELLVEELGGSVIMLLLGSGVIGVLFACMGDVLLQVVVYSKLN